MSPALCSRLNDTAGHFVASDNVELPGDPGASFKFRLFSRPMAALIYANSQRVAVFGSVMFVVRTISLTRLMVGIHPKGSSALLKRDEDKSHEQLAAEPLHYDFQLRHYQQTAIRAIEKGIADGRREMLLAMATGTGKTKTCIALIYRLLKAQRFKRILFLVDRSALGEQAANAFKDTRMENLQTFADIFGIKELEEQKPDTDTAVHIATVQGMVQRVLVSRRRCRSRQQSISTTASSSTNAIAAICLTASCPTPS